MRFDYNYPLPYKFEKQEKVKLLTKAEVREIRQNLDKISIRDLAKKYGVHHTTISNIKSGRSHKHAD